MSEKLDLRKQWKNLYAPSSKNVAIVDVPEFLFVMMDGSIEPGLTPETSQAFQETMGALYGVTYTLKFNSKLRKSNPIDYTVMALEGLWWTGAGEFDFDASRQWNWTMMVMQPNHITEEMFRVALHQVEVKRPNPALAGLRLERLREGLCVQIMHVGPYSQESQSIAKMKAFAEQNGYRLHGLHHEIYLGDPRRAQPDRLKTVLRHPIER